MVFDSLARGDRRKYPRGVAPNSLHIDLPIVLDVTVVDISETGVLFRCSYPVSVGQRLHLRTVLGAEPFVAWLEVVRIDERRPPDAGPRFSVGAVFTGSDGENIRRLQQFLAR